MRWRLCGVCCLAGLFNRAFITPPLINQRRQSCWGQRVPPSTFHMASVVGLLAWSIHLSCDTRTKQDATRWQRKLKNKTTNKRFTFNANKAGEILILVPCVCSMCLSFCILLGFLWECWVLLLVPNLKIFPQCCEAETELPPPDSIWRHHWGVPDGVKETFRFTVEALAVLTIWQ